jgi:hypothetical protein
MALHKNLPFPMQLPKNGFSHSVAFLEHAWAMSGKDCFERYTPPWNVGRSCSSCGMSIIIKNCVYGV